MEWLIAHGEKALRPETRSSNLVLCYKKSQVHYEPLGVVAGIVSWNYRMPFIPFVSFQSALFTTFASNVALHNAWSPILASIFAGNACVLKCSENVIWSTTWFVDVIKRCLVVCGHDPELVQVR